jgi:uncharacterized protein
MPLPIALVVMLLFLILEVICIPLLYHFLVFFTDIKNLNLWMQAASIISGFLLLASSLFFLSEKEKKAVLGRQCWSLQPLLSGFITALICTPIIFFISSLLKLLVDSFFGESVIDQVAVTLLKNSYNKGFFFAFLAFLMSFIVPITEELLFRGYVQSALDLLFGRYVAIFVTCSLFTLFHYASSQGQANFEILPPLFLLSILLSYMKEKYDSILASIALHSTFNFISVFFLFFESK